MFAGTGARVEEADVDAGVVELDATPVPDPGVPEMTGPLGYRYHTTAMMAITMTMTTTLMIFFVSSIKIVYHNGYRGIGNIGRIPYYTS